MKNWHHCVWFLGGVLFGTAGFKILGSQDAKKLYTSCTAAVLRCKDTVLEKKDILAENCNDIYEDAKDINLKRDEARRAKEYAEAEALLNSRDDSTTEV